MEPLCDFLEPRYFKVFDNRDLRWSNELMVRIAFLVTLFNDAFYLMDSEPALGRGYGDLLLRVRPDMPPYALLDHLLEFKTLGPKAVGLTSAELATTTREALGALPAVAEARRASATGALSPDAGRGRRHAQAAHARGGVHRAGTAGFHPRRSSGRAGPHTQG